MTAEPMPADRLAEIEVGIPTTYGPPWTAQPSVDAEGNMAWDVLYDTTSPDAGLVATFPDYAEHLAEFAARARRDVPDLLAEVKRLRCTDPIECGHEAALGQAEAELARRDHAAAEDLADQTLMKGLTVEGGKTVLSLIPPREIAELWVHCARGMLGDAPNYSETPVEMEVGLAGERERFALIVQRVGKTTPHEAREQTEAERDRLRHALERAALSVEHDRASRACQERNMPIHDEDCPACEVQAALHPEQVQL